MKVVGFAALWASKRDSRGVVMYTTSTLPEPPPSWADRAISDYYYGTPAAPNSNQINSLAAPGAVVPAAADPRGSGGSVKYSRSSKGSLMDDVRVELTELSDRGRDLLFEYSERLMVRRSVDASRATRSACAAVGCGFCGTLMAWAIFSSLAPLGLVAGATAGATLALADARPSKRRRSPFEKLLLAWSRACTACVLAGWMRLRTKLGDASSDIKLRAENFDYQTFSLKDWALDVDDRLHVTDKAKIIAQNATQFFENTFKIGRSLVKEVAIESANNNNKPVVSSYTSSSQPLLRQQLSTRGGQPAGRQSQQQTVRPSYRRSTPPPPPPQSSSKRRYGVDALRETAFAAPKKVWTGLKRLVPPIVYQQQPQQRQTDVIVVPQPSSMVQSFLPLLVLIAYDRSAEISSALDIVRVSVDEALASIPHLPFFTHFF